MTVITLATNADTQVFGVHIGLFCLKKLLYSVQYDIDDV